MQEEYEQDNWAKKLEGTKVKERGRQKQGQMKGMAEERMEERKEARKDV